MFNDISTIPTIRSFDSLTGPSQNKFPRVVNTVGDRKLVVGRVVYMMEVLEKFVDLSSMRTRSRTTFSITFQFGVLMFQDHLSTYWGGGDTE